MAKARQQYFADETSIAKDSREFAITPELLEKINSIESGAQVNVIETVKVNGEVLTPDENKAVDIDVPLVDDTLYSTSSEDALSARQGRILYDYIQNIQSRGRFLSNWNCVTGLAITNPADNPYTYHSGDYYLVSNVAALGGTNYKPDGNQYIINQASTTVESQTVKVGDMYIYDGTYWILLVNTEREIAVDSSLSTTSTNPVENRVVTNTLNGKQDTISDLAAIRAGAALGDTALQPGDSLSQLTGTADDITEGSTNLFMTTTERSKLSNQSGVNTGDETQTTIKNKLGQASTSTDGYLTSTDWNTFNGKQDAISDLATIRSNASAGKSASDTIATYGDIVTHDVSEFATSAQGALADTAIQPLGNVSELTNDAGYVTSAYHDATKQDVLVAGNNIQIAADGVTISATDTTYVASDFDIKDLSDSTGLRTEWSGKQDELIAGTNIQIASDGKTISATDTTYTAGVNVSISNNNVISATDSKAEWGNITGTLTDQTDLNTALDGKQDELIAGTNIQIASDGKTISATDTTYTAGSGIAIDANNVISNTQTSAEWGNIQGDITDQTDLQTQFGTKQDTLIAGTNIQIAADGKTISATDTTYQPTDFDIKDLADSTNLRTTWSGKQNTIVAGTNVQIAADGVTISATDTTYTASDFDIKDLTDSTGLRTTWSGKQDELIAGANIQIAADGKTISATDTTYTASDFDIKDLTDSTGLRTTWSGKQDAISDLATIRTGAGKGATAVQPLDNVSTLTNDAGYITKSVNDLTNYYTKSETYTKSEVADLVANFAGFKVVATLPTTDIKTNIIYLLGPVGSGADKYEEYIYSNNSWVMIGETSVDLTNYFNTSTQTADNITEGNTHLFLTGTERNKLTNTSGINTGDETKTTIQTKLGASSASNGGYLTSTDWSTFNGKQDALTAGTGIDITDGVISNTQTSAEWGNIQGTLSDQTDLNTALGNKANTSDVLTKTNTTSYTPSDEYHPATKKYVDDNISAATQGAVSDEAYAASWNGVTGIAPSKNAVYDKINAMDTTISGKADSSSLATVATSGSYNDLSNKPTIGTANLTIQKNGTTVATFGANATSGVTANIAVPTKTSDLSNDSNFVASTSLATVATSGDYDDLINKPTIGNATLTIQKNSTTIDTFSANATTNKTINVSVPTTVAELSDASDYATTASLATVATSGDYDDLLDKPSLSTVATSGSYNDLSNKPTIPSVIDNLTSTSTTNALSANQGKALKDMIDDLQALGKFLSLWDSSTGLPISFPQATPYTYSTGDYYLVETVDTTINYRPNGSSYTGTASTTVETEEVEVGDLYIYDGSVWLLQLNHGKSVSFANLTGQPSDNAALNTELNTKTFYLTGTTGSTNIATAQAAYDWYKAGKNPMIIYSSTLYGFWDTNGGLIRFISLPNDFGDSASYSELRRQIISFGGSGTTVSSISSGNANGISYLKINKNYSTPYTPEYDGSPTTKKYVDDKVSDTAYASTWDGVTTIAPSKNAVYDKISAMDTTISGKANDNAVVKLTGNQTIAGTKTFSTSPVVPSKTTDVSNTGTAIATEAQVYKILPTVVTASGYSQVSNPVAGKIYFIKES